VLTLTYIDRCVQLGKKLYKCNVDKKVKEMIKVKENRVKKPYLIAIAIVGIIIIVVVLALFVSGILNTGFGSIVSIKEASLSWKYNPIDGKYYVSNITVVLTNNDRDQLFNLDIEVVGNWPVEYEHERGFTISVGAGLNPGETRTISRSGWELLTVVAGTKQTGTYTVTLRVVKYKYNEPLFGEVEKVYGERTITTHVP